MKEMGGGERRFDSQGAQVHLETFSGRANYHSGERQDGSGGRFITVGDSKNHTTFLYDRNGVFERSVSRGDGGPAKNAIP